MTVIGFAMAVIILPKIWINNYEKTQGWMIASTITSIFFVLLEAYYGGAMTMFFTSEITIPFKSLSDVMEAYPTWKLKTQSALGASVPKVILTRYMHIILKSVMKSLKQLFCH